MLTAEDTVPSTLLVSVDSLFLEVTSVVRSEVDERVVEKSESLEGVDDLSDAPVHLFDVVAISAVFGTTFELVGGMKDRVHLDPGHHQQERLTFDDLLPLLDELDAFGDQTLGEVPEVDRLFDVVEVPHHDSVHDSALVCHDVQRGCWEKNQHDDEDDGYALSDDVVPDEQRRREDAEQRDAGKNAVQLRILREDELGAVVAEALRIAHRQTVEDVETPSQRMMAEVAGGATVDAEMPLACTQRHTTVCVDQVDNRLCSK